MALVTNLSQPDPVTSKKKKFNLFGRHIFIPRDFVVCGGYGGRKAHTRGDGLGRREEGTPSWTSRTFSSVYHFGTDCREGYY